MPFKKTLLFLTVFLTSTTLIAAPQLHLSSARVKQGNPLRVTITSAVAIKKASLIWQGKTVPMFYHPSSTAKRSVFSTLLGISKKQKPGRYRLKCYVAAQPHSKRRVAIASVTVTDAKFISSHVTLPKKKATLSKDAGQTQKEARFLSGYFRKISRKSWLDATPFSLPVKGRITSPFGAFRLYNGKAGRHHSGVDIGAKAQTRLNASHHGKVTLSIKLAHHGNTVMIDHGQGVISIYNHLAKRSVIKGQTVRQGQIIGHVGETGIATAPHVHWGVSIHNERVNPLALMDERLFLLPEF